MDKKILFQGQYLQLSQRNHWEFVERVNCNGVVSIIALTQDESAIFVEQFRPALMRTVIEFPAGLVADQAEHAQESLTQAATRELYEETGYHAENLIMLNGGPPSPGLSDEIITYFIAQNVKKIGEGGGVGFENIKIHEVPLPEIDHYLSDYQRNHGVVAMQVYAGLYLLHRFKIANPSII